MSRTHVDDVARQLGVPPRLIGALVERTLAELPQATYYVFRADPTGDADDSGSVGSQAQRTIAAFPSPDDALSFAQRNGYAMAAPLRPLAARDLILLLLRDASIETLLFLRSAPGEDGARGFPPGVKMTRQSILEQMAAMDEQPEILTAEAYDALRFGVDFSRRGAFRAALTAAVDEVVANYVPPPGSLDHGPRSIYASSVVEMWLRTHGFPHATQRRWVNVEHQPEWGGAEELCEIDCGTEQRLFVQLPIFSDGKRQYIGQVIVTS